MSQHSFATHNLRKALFKVTNKAFRQRGFTISSIVLDWPLIIGEKLANQTRPLSLRFHKQGPYRGVLTLQASPSWVLLIQQNEPIIIEKINQYYGYKAVDKIRLFQNPVRPLKTTKPITARSFPESSCVKEILASHPEDPLKIALQNLGNAVYATKKS